MSFKPTDGTMGAHHCADLLFAIWSSDETLVVCWVKRLRVAFPGDRLGPPVIWEKTLPMKKCWPRTGTAPFHGGTCHYLHFFKVMTTLPEVLHFWNSRVSSVRNCREQEQVILQANDLCTITGGCKLWPIYQPLPIPPDIWIIWENRKVNNIQTPTVLFRACWDFRQASPPSGEHVMLEYAQIL